MYRKEEGTWDGRIRDGGTNSTLRIKEQEKRLTLNEHDDDKKPVTSVVLMKLQPHLLCHDPVNKNNTCDLIHTFWTIKVKLYLSLPRMHIGGDGTLSITWR